MLEVPGTYSEAIAEITCGNCPLGQVPEAAWQKNVQDDFTATGVVQEKISPDDLGENLAALLSQLRHKGTAPEEALGETNSELVDLYNPEVDDGCHTGRFQFSPDRSRFRVAVEGLDVPPYPNLDYIVPIEDLTPIAKPTATCFTTVYNRECTPAKFSELNTPVALDTQRLYNIAQTGNVEEVQTAATQILEAMAAWQLSRDETAKSLFPSIDPSTRSPQHDRELLLRSVSALRSLREDLEQQ
jgi:hypothetical protein